MNAINRLQVGTRFRYAGDEWTVVTLQGAAIRARSQGGDLALLSIHEVMQHGNLISEDDSDDTEDESYFPHFVALPASAVPVKDSRAEERARAVRLLLTGYEDGIGRDGEPQSPYGPGSGEPLTNRVAAYANDHGIGASTLWRWIGRAKESGAGGLTDGRRLGVVKPYGNCPQEVIDAMRHIAAQQANLSKVTDRALLQQVKRLVRARHGDSVPIPSKRSLYRYWEKMGEEFNLHLGKPTQRTNKRRPKKMGKPLVVSAPFEVVEIDSSPIDLMAISPIDGKSVKVVLTVAVDVYSRSIVAARFSPISEKSVDIALLLHDMMTPTPWQSTWGDAARWNYGVPETLILPRNVDSITPIAGVPVGKPTTVTLDNGKPYASNALKSAAERLGINLQHARKATPTDKPHVERLFGTIRSRFVQYLPGFTGSRLEHRGSKANVDDAACLLIPEVESLFAQWVAVEYQNTPHEGLFHPAIPSQKITPNEMYDLGIAATGFVPVLADRDLAISLLPGTARQIGTVGIAFKNLGYDSPLLEPYRNRLSPFSELNGRWPVRFDSRDLSHIWVWLGDTHDRLIGQWVRIPCRITDAVGAFSDIHLAYAKSLFANDGNRVQRNILSEEIESTMEEMFDRVAMFGAANRREATVFRQGFERVQAALATFPHQLDQPELGEYGWHPDFDEDADEELDPGYGFDFDFDDIEPFDTGIEEA